MTANVNLINLIHKFIYYLTNHKFYLGFPQIQTVMCHSSQPKSFNSLIMYNTQNQIHKLSSNTIE